MLPPHAQLRGGAMVVLSKSINPDSIQIWAYPLARINILEPSALKAIKFRKAHTEELLKRHNIDVDVAGMAAAEPVIDTFFNLHDKPGSSVGVVDRVVPWAEMRTSLYASIHKQKYGGPTSQRR